MPSPFPGMDPWLEAPGVFPDIHDALIFLLREALNATLPKGYRARGANRIWMEEDRQRIPDVSVTRPGDWVPEANGGVAVEAYTKVGMLDVETSFLPEPLTEQFIEIYSTAGERLVTAIEILSPTNKTAGDAGRGAYRQKQSECRTGRVNLVEIDLLRGGQHTTAIPLRELRQRAGQYDYHVCVADTQHSGHFFVSAFTLKDPLPTIAVPLDESTSPVSVALQPLFERAYETGRYDASTYRNAIPEPRLNVEQQAWAESILREKGILK